MNPDMVTDTTVVSDSPIFMFTNTRRRLIGLEASVPAGNGLLNHLLPTPVQTMMLGQIILVPPITLGWIVHAACHGCLLITWPLWSNLLLH
jgi:hypothetical protein